MSDTPKTPADALRPVTQEPDISRIALWNVLREHGVSQDVALLIVSKAAESSPASPPPGEEQAAEGGDLLREAQQSARVAHLIERLTALDCTMVEVCEPHPGNPSGNIIPMARKELLAALAQPAALSSGDRPAEPKVSREAVARIIDPDVWVWHDRLIEEASAERIKGRAQSLRENAADYVVRSLTKANAILALSNPPADVAGWREALQLARPIVESDLCQAEEMSDADWEGMSRTALTAIDAALAAAPANLETGAGKAEGEWRSILEMWPILQRAWIDLASAHVDANGGPTTWREIEKVESAMRLALASPSAPLGAGGSEDGQRAGLACSGDEA